MRIKVASDLRGLFETNRNEFKKALAAQLRSHEDSLRALFHPWRTNSRATIATVDIEELHVNEDGSGEAHCMYVEKIYMGCKDLDSEDEQSGSLNFKYLRDQEEVRFEESKPPERNTIEEF
jgi:hypothetical protein